MSKIEKLVQCLQGLEQAKYNNPEEARRTNAAADRALNLIFAIGKQRLQFSDAQKKTLANLISSTLKHLQAHVERVGCLYRTRLDSATLRMRSAIQFLIDDYGTFPATNKTLSKVFEQENIKETVGILNDIIRKWQDESDSEVESDRDTNGIPSSHTWWRS